MNGPDINPLIPGGFSFFWAIGSFLFGLALFAAFVLVVVLLVRYLLVATKAARLYVDTHPRTPPAPAPAPAAPAPAPAAPAADPTPAAPAPAADPTPPDVPRTVKPAPRPRTPKTPPAGS